MVIAETTKFHKMESENFVTGGIKFKNSVIASLFASTSVFPGSSESIVLHCENATVKLEAGTLIINWRNGKKKKSSERNLELAVVLILWLFHLIGIKILYLILQNQLAQMKNLKLLEKKH